MKVVFIGVDPQTAEMALLSLRLRWPDATPLVATTAAAGLELVEQVLPDVVLLHPSFSDLSLSKAIKELRGFSDVPLLVLGHQGGEMEVFTALELGADDYVRLPCELTEMMARVWLSCGVLRSKPITRGRSLCAAVSCSSTLLPTRCTWVVSR